MAAITVVYDACVLYPAPLRDLLVSLARTGLFRARWTDAIHEEWINNLLLNRPDLNRASLERTRQRMNEAILDCLVTDYEDLIPHLTLPDANDRHVLAAAVRARANGIVTCNQKHFPEAMVGAYDIAVWHPDDFVSNLLDNYEDEVCIAVKAQRDRLKSPSATVEQFLATLERQSLKGTVARLERLAHRLQ